MSECERCIKFDNQVIELENKLTELQDKYNVLYKVVENSCSDIKSLVSDMTVER